MRADLRARLAAFTLYAGLGLVALYLWLPAPASGLATRWLFSWQDGFPRRALAGTVLRMLPATVDLDLVAQAGATIAVLLVVASAWMLARLTVDHRGPALDRTLVAIALLTSAVGWPAVAANVGRLDQVLLLCGLAAAGCLARVGPVRDVVAAGLLVVATLVNELAVALVVVWVAAWAAHRATEQKWPARRAVGRAVRVATPAVVAFLVVSTMRPAMDPAAAVAALANGTDIDLRPRVVEVQYWGVGENLAMMGRAWGKQALPRLAGSVAAVLPLALACWAVLRDRGVGWRSLRPTERALMVASAAPLGLTAVAVDFGRWFATATVLLVVSTLVVLGRVDDRSRPGPWVWAALGLVPVSLWVSGPTMARGYQWLVG